MPAFAEGDGSVGSKDVSVRKKEINSSWDMMANNNTMPSIAEFFADKSIFVTGATGFIGKVLVEKLLRSCPAVKEIFLLVRPKAGQAAKSRIEDITSCKMFDKLKNEQPDSLKKLVVVEGDIQEPNLGISEEDTARLHNEVSVVYHSAATVKFDEKLSLALKLNVGSVQKMVALCHGMKKLEVLVHVSTAYANCDRKHIEEVVYPPPMDPYKLMNTTEWMSEEMITSITTKIIGNRPNTYTFTKALAEYVLMQEGEGLPFCIVRPSIVGAAWKEPLPGWIDNFNGPSGLFIATGIGMLRSMLGNIDGLADISPVDYVCNLLIAASWHTGVHRPASPPIYNCVTSTTNPSRWNVVEDIAEYYTKTPLEMTVRRPSAFFTQNPFIYNYAQTVGAKIPSYFIDMLLQLKGKKPRMVKMCNRIYKSVDTLKYFTFNHWEWSNHNLEALQAVMSEEDKKVFYTDVRPLDWQSYIEAYCVGTKQYVLKEDLNSIHIARRHIRMLRNLRWMFNTVLLVVFWRVLIARSQIARNLWYFVLNLFFKFLRYCRATSSTQ
ncbi:fatty acyl-CoA reductase 1-like isoform X1 [Asterias rubens]|uniref:fatty acyl-CoA reductase 1-like isoform X1 n=2 Tax=Asterias rubens TaxID=7604 RepID=UPI001455070C|nr:fatty acyl-CoA reductase 1-like isoform X1 [Asterias rubens]